MRRTTGAFVNPISRGLLALLLPGICAMAIAQVPPDEAPSAQAGAIGQDVPCVPAAGATQAISGESGQLKIPPEEDGDAFEPCEEKVSDAALGEETVLEEVPGDSAAGIEADAEQTTGAEISGEGVFKPVDEISEDYPVPLPSDI